MAKHSWKVTIQCDKSEKNSLVRLPSKIYRICTATQTRLQFGTWHIDVTIRPNDTDTNIVLPEWLLQNSGITNGMTTNLCLQNNGLRIGPIIGVFVSPKYVHRLLRKQQAHSRTRALFEANEVANVTLYFFSWKDVSFLRRRVQGTYYDTVNKVWSKGSFPIPDVLYERGSSSRYRQQNNRIRRFFVQHGVQRLNAVHSLDKCHMHKVLVRDNRIKSYLPKTVSYTGPKDIQRLRSQRVYIKQRVSNNGKRVMRVVRIPRSGYHYSYYTKRLIEGKSKQLQHVNYYVRRFLGSKRLIAQQGIPLLTIGDRIVDMRATVQRNGRGELEITSTVARVGGHRSPVTSTRTGSQCYPLANFLTSHLLFTTEESKEALKKIEHFLKTTYHCMEKAYGTFGELGIDFGLDQGRRIWLIECNAKPAKEALYRTGNVKTIRRAFLNPLEYAKYLMHFNNI